MSRVARVLLPIVLTALSFSSALAQTRESYFKSYMISAASQESRSDIGPAERLYRLAIQAAPALVDHVEAQIRLAGLLSRRTGKGEEAVRRRKEAEELYQTAIAGASGEQRLRVRNDLGVFLFRCGRTSEAADLFASLAKEPWPGPQGSLRRARLLFNYGQVLRREDRDAEAASLFLESMRLDPRFAPARQAAQSLAESPRAASHPPESDPAVPLLAELLSQQRTSEAATLLRQLARNPERLRFDADRFTHLFLRYLEDEGLSLDSFAHDWDAPSLQLAQGLPAEAAECIAEIRMVYTMPPLPADWRPDTASQLFPCWNRQGWVQPFIRFLKAVGDAFAEANAPREALGAYAMAAGLSPADTEATLFLGNLLVKYRALLDPSGELLERFTRERASVTTSLDNPRGLEQEIFLHSLLAADAQERQRLGPEDDPLSAVFQWRRAVEISERLAAAVPTQSHPRPEMLEQLAASYEGLGDLERAEETYRAAALGYQSLNETDQALALLAHLVSYDDELISPTAITQLWSDQGVRKAGLSQTEANLVRTSSRKKLMEIRGDEDRRESSSQVAAMATPPQAMEGSQKQTTLDAGFWMVSPSDLAKGNSSTSEELPATGSFWPAAGFAGLVSLLGALAIRKVRRNI